MGDTFGQIASSVRLRVPQAPIFLVEDWVREAFRRAWESRRPAWSMARKEGSFSTADQKTGTSTVTKGSVFVTPGTLSIALTDEGRQFRTGINQPIYSIECIDIPNNQIELDRIYTGPSGTLDSRILDAYITFPEDFEKFVVVLDPQNFWQLRHWVTDDQLNRWDPQRSSTTTPWALVSRRYATVTKFKKANQLVGRKQFELWPYATSAHEYWYFYVTRAPTLAEDDEFPGLLGDRGDVLRQGALSLAAEWPGTEDRKNPYFNLSLSKRLRDDFEFELARLEITDEDIYPTWWQQVNWVDVDSFSPIDARFLQSHDSP